MKRLSALCALMAISSMAVSLTASAAEIRVTNLGKTWLVQTTDPKVEIHISQNGRMITVSDEDKDRQVEFDTQTQRLRVGPDRDIEVSLDENRPFYFRRGGQVIASFRKEAAANARTRRTPARSIPATPRSTPAPRNANRKTQKLYTIARGGRLMQIEIRDRQVQTTQLAQLTAPFPTHGVLTEGLAMDKEGQLYAAVNVAVEFTRKTTSTGQQGQEGESLLYRIDPQTGEVTRVGGIGHRQVDGLSFGRDGKLYGVTSILGGGEKANLLRIDPNTARAQTVGSDLSLGDLDCIAVIAQDRALVVDGIGLRDAFYELRLNDPRREPRRLASTPNIIHNSRDLEGLTLGREDGFLYAFTSPDAQSDARVHLLQIDPQTFEHTNLGLMKFGAYCLAADASHQNDTDKTEDASHLPPEERGD